MQLTVETIRAAGIPIERADDDGINGFIIPQDRTEDQCATLERLVAQTDGEVSESA